MQTWLHQHEFFASWMSAIAGVLAALLTAVAMFRASKREGVPFKWNQAVLRIGFLLCLAGILSPSLPSEARATVGSLAAMLLVYVGWQANRE
jgi:hypothetical protein